MSTTKFAIDLDGVITANPSAVAWLTYHLLKNENNHEVYVLTWRDGSDEARVQETSEDLRRFGICYTKIIMAPRKFKNMRVACFWKVSQIRKLNAHIWIDDELKAYKRDYGVDVQKLLPDTILIGI